MAETKNLTSNFQLPTSKDSKLKLAIVCDWIYGGGGERVVEELHRAYPDAPIYTSYCSDEWRTRLDNKVITGYLQKPPFRQLRKFLPLLRQWWFSRLDLSEFELVISVTGNGEAKFVRVPNGKHVCYCHTPVHFYWRNYDEYLENPGFKPKWLARLGLKLLVKHLRARDFDVAQRVDYFIANSSHIQADILKYYQRESQVIHPPVETSRFQQPAHSYQPVARQGFITVGRQVPYKHTEIIIKACNELDAQLTVIGQGPEHEKLAKMAGPTVKVLNDVSDDDLPNYMAGAEAFLLASFEDFGVTPVEAMAAGTPVIAYKAGGALDYVVEGVTGSFFADQSTASLAACLQNFDSKKFNSNDIKSSALAFSVDNFKDRMKNIVAKLVGLER